MKRAIVIPAVLPSSALAEVKQWLGITTAHDDALLTGLLQSAIELCEAFTGIVPLECGYEEILPVSGQWCALSVRPVQAITGVEGITESGDRFTMVAGAYATELDTCGAGQVRVIAPGAARRLAVQFTAGVASTWSELPEPLRHGIVRLAAHQHRERESSGAAPLPPASVAALWRPWRRVHLL